MIYLENNFNQNTMNNIKKLVENGKFDEAISQIPPDMIQNFSKILGQSQNDNTKNSNVTANSNSNNSSYNNMNDSNNSNKCLATNINSINYDYENTTKDTINDTNCLNDKDINNTQSSTLNETNSNNTNSNNFNNIDINMIMKIASKLNSSNQNDSRQNLLNALKPYLRDSKKGKMDNYINMLNMAKMADLFKNNFNSSQEND